MTLPKLEPGFELDTEPLVRARLQRVYWPTQDPLRASVAQDNRYDCPSFFPSLKQFGVLYLAFDLETCWMETVVRQNMIRPAGQPIPVPLAKLGRWACEVTSEQSLRLARFADVPLIDLGECASNIMSNSYARTKRWSAMMHAHGNPEVDGLYYRSRYKSDRFCVALFDRAIKQRGLMVRNARDIDPAKSTETQSIMQRYRVVPI